MNAEVGRPRGKGEGKLSDRILLINQSINQSIGSIQIV